MSQIIAQMSKKHNSNEQKMLLMSKIYKLKRAKNSSYQQKHNSNEQKIIQNEQNNCLNKPKKKVKMRQKQFN